MVHRRFRFCLRSDEQGGHYSRRCRRPMVRREGLRIRKRVADRGVVSWVWIELDVVGCRQERIEKERIHQKLRLEFSANPKTSAYILGVCPCVHRELRSLWWYWGGVVGGSVCVDREAAAVGVEQGVHGQARRRTGQTRRQRPTYPFALTTYPVICCRLCLSLCTGGQRCSRRRLFAKQQ